MQSPLTDLVANFVPYIVAAPLCKITQGSGVLCTIVLTIKDRRCVFGCLSVMVESHTRAELSYVHAKPVCIKIDWPSNSKFP